MCMYVILVEETSKEKLENKLQYPKENSNYYWISTSLSSSGLSKRSQYAVFKFNILN